MNTLVIVAFIASAICYIYLVIFGIRDTIIEKLTNLYIYTDPHFANRSKHTRNDWDSLNYGTFINKRPIIFALLVNAFFILGLPFFAAIFSAILFGKVPVSSEIESLANVQIMVTTIAWYYLFAVIGVFYHIFSFKKYKNKASEDKSYWEAKSILMG